jgi:hypothetical protein
MSAESMVDSYPVLTLEQVHGALAFYLGNQKEIDAYLTEGNRTAESQHEQSRRTNAELIAEQTGRCPRAVAERTADQAADAVAQLKAQQDVADNLEAQVRTRLARQLTS